MLGADGYPLFSLARTDEHVAITGYKTNYLTPREERIVLLLEKFEVMDSHIVIKLWLEGGDSINEYLSEP